jgi:molybdate transport system ATP-binding protein
VIDIDMALRRGGFRLDAAFRSDARLTGLFGRSGAGKSSLIAAVAGLIRPHRGHIIIDGIPLFDTERGIDVPPHKRRIGLVFQDAQLFPHLSVRANLRYGSRFAPKGDPGLGFDLVVAVLGIGHLLDRRPASLSGGERQRVAIGRALLAKSRLVLLDEPLASLDMARKLEILALIERLRDEAGVPMLYVSHAVEEVVRLAGEVVVLEGGRVARAGPPEAVLEAARSPSEARFGAVSLITARIASHDLRYGLTLLDHPAGPISIPGRTGIPGEPARVIVHGTDVSLALTRPSDVSIRTLLEGVVKATRTDEGPVARVDVTLKGSGELSAFVTRKSLDELGLSAGDAVYAMIKTASIEEGAGRSS